MSVIVLYRPQDSHATAERFIDSLSHTLGAENLVTNVEKFVRPGDDYLDAIEDGVVASQAVIVVIGTQWAEGGWLDNPHDFMNIALAKALRDKKRIIPVLIEGATMPANLNESFNSLQRRQAISLTDANLAANIQPILSVLKELMPAKSANTQPIMANPPHTPPPSASPYGAQPQSTPPPYPYNAPQAQAGYGAPPPPPPSGIYPNMLGGYPPTGGLVYGQINAVPNGLQLADIGKRFGAILVDWIILVVINSIMIGVGYGIASSSNEVDSFSHYWTGEDYVCYNYNSYYGTYDCYYASDFPYAILHSALNLLIAGAYFTLFTASSGQTPGKKLSGIKVVGEDGRPLSFGRVLLRETIGRWLSGAILLIGYLIAFSDNRKQALHDKFASSLVVNVAPAPRPIMPPYYPPQPPPYR